MYFSCLDIYGQQVILQPPIITAFECTEFNKLYTCIVQNFSDVTYEAVATIAVNYRSPDGSMSRLAEGTLSGSPSITIIPNTTNISLGNYQSIYTSRNVNFQNSNVERLLSKSNCLPPGQYDVCLTFYPFDATIFGDNFIAQTCYEFEKEMLTSLFLVSPFENEELTLDLPLFTWTAVLPFNPQANYRIQIVELLANQTPFEAFRSNPIFFEQSGLMSNIFQYPIAARPMLPCTRYAWRVSYELENGFNNPSFLKSPSFFQQSEIWEYRRPCDVEKVEEEDELTDLNSPYDKYHNINYYSSSSIIPVTDYQLRLIVDNTYYSEENFNYQIIDKNGKLSEYECCWMCCDGLEDSDDNSVVERKVYDKRKNIDLGLQKLKIDLDALGLKADEVYTIRIETGKESKNIKFKITL